MNSSIDYLHRLLTIQIEHLVSSFQDLEIFRSQNSDAASQRSYAHAALNDKIERKHARKTFGLLPQGYCERKTPKS